MGLEPPPYIAAGARAPASERSGALAFLERAGGERTAQRVSERESGRTGGGRGPRAAGGPGCVGKLGTGGGAGCPGLAADVERRGGQAGEGPGSPSVSPTPAPQSVPLFPSYPRAPPPLWPAGQTGVGGGGGGYVSPLRMGRGVG